MLSQHMRYKTRNDTVFDLIFSSKPGIINNLDVRENLEKAYNDHIISTFDMIFRNINEICTKVYL